LLETIASTVLNRFISLLSDTRRPLLLSGTAFFVSGRRDFVYGSNHQLDPHYANLSRLHNWGFLRGDLLLFFCGRRSWRGAVLMRSDIVLTPPRLCVVPEGAETAGVFMSPAERVKDRYCTSFTH
jgi:hypothetical protein